MDIRALVPPANIIPDVTAADKAALLRELAVRAAPSVRVSSDRIFSEIMKRENLGSTGMGDGIAIPHVRLAEITKPVGFLARLHDPIDFESVDGQPVDLVLLLLLPASSKEDQLSALACAARVLRDADRVEHMRRATTARMLHEVMTTDMPPAGQHAPKH